MKKIVEFIKGLLNNETDPFTAVSVAVAAFSEARNDLLDAADRLEDLAADRNAIVARLRAEVTEALTEAARAASIAAKLEDLLN